MDSSERKVIFDFEQIDETTYRGTVKYGVKKYNFTCIDSEVDIFHKRGGTIPDDKDREAIEGYIREECVIGPNLNGPYGQIMNIIYATVDDEGDISEMTDLVDPRV